MNAYNGDNKCVSCPYNIIIWLLLSVMPVISRFERFYYICKNPTRKEINKQTNKLINVQKENSEINVKQ